MLSKAQDAMVFASLFGSRPPCDQPNIPLGALKEQEGASMSRKEQQGSSRRGSLEVLRGFMGSPVMVVHMHVHVYLSSCVERQIYDSGLKH